MVCERQAVSSWGGFDLKPSFAQVIEALENLGTRKKQSGVIFLAFFQIILTNFISGEKELTFKYKFTYVIRFICPKILIVKVLHYLIIKAYVHTLKLSALTLILHFFQLTEIKGTTMYSAKGDDQFVHPPDNLAKNLLVKDNTKAHLLNQFLRTYFFRNMAYVSYNSPFTNVICTASSRNN